MTDSGTITAVQGALITIIPVARGRAAMRGLIWCAAAIVVGLLVIAMASRLDFTPTGVRSRLVEWCVALVLLPMAAATLVAAGKGVRWLLLALWCARVGVDADAKLLTLRLGPFGTYSYAVAEIDFKYLFELSGDEESFEAFLPAEQQRATMLPRMVHPRAREPIQRTILCFALGTEREMAERIEPWVRRVRGET